MTADERDAYMKTILENQAKIFNQNEELIFANVFHDTIKGSSWLPDDFPLSPGRGALGYPALYVLYRVLNEFHPQQILEMGMGQSTKMIGLYNHKHTSCRHQVVEHDSKWIAFFRNHFTLPATTEIVTLPIIDIPLQIDGVSHNVTIYQEFPDHFQGQAFDFICIDGPYGFRSPQYSRVDIITILPECLKSSFVILLDDCDRTGERNTLQLICHTLEEHGIAYDSNIYWGEKGTGIVVSRDLSFLCTL